GAVSEKVPAAKNQIIEISQGHEILDLGNPLLRAFSKPHRTHLRERTYRERNLSANRFHACDHCSRDCPHADRKNTQLPLRFCYWNLFVCHFSRPPPIR